MSQDVPTRLIKMVPVLEYAVSPSCHEGFLPLQRSLGLSSDMILTLTTEWTESHIYPDVMYNNTRGLWVCCGNIEDGKPDCTNQTSETFNLAPPQDLRPFFSIPLSGFPYTSASIQTISSTVVAPSTTASSQPAAVAGSRSSSGSSSLSSAAAAGIGAGAGVAVLLFSLAGIAVWYLRRKSLRAREHQTDHQTSPETSGPRNIEHSGTFVKSELTGRSLPLEMPGNTPRELPS
ncbi:hypothetical protein PG991_003383 [Apiospora marii]|uniref:Uncharacterized protein n=1 Tax=Apiospora marii TaxID=335849 RepID=A0ABR1S393_9PEZI